MNKKDPEKISNLNDYNPLYRLVVPKREKYPTGRAIATAYWISYFALHWLIILDVVELNAARAATTSYFLLSAVAATVMTAAHEAMEKKNE